MFAHVVKCDQISTYLQLFNPWLLSYLSTVDQSVGIIPYKAFCSHKILITILSLSVPHSYLYHFPGRPDALWTHQSGNNELSKQTGYQRNKTKRIKNACLWLWSLLNGKIGFVWKSMSCKIQGYWSHLPTSLAIFLQGNGIEPPLGIKPQIPSIMED